MPTYKLVYFPIGGRAELARYLFAAAGQDYEDKRIKEEWPEMKPKTLFGSLPILFVDGKPLAQSMAIARYLARQFGFAGKGAWEEAQVDMVAYGVSDILESLVAIFKEKDEAKKADIRKNLTDEVVPKGLQNLEKLLTSNKDGNAYFVGDGMTYADMHLALMFDWFGFAGVTVDKSKIPKLVALKQRVESSPKIAAWIAKRPS